MKTLKLFGVIIITIIGIFATIESSAQNVIQFKLNTIALGKYDRITEEWDFGPDKDMDGVLSIYEASNKIVIRGSGADPITLVYYDDKTSEENNWNWYEWACIDEVGNDVRVAIGIDTTTGVIMITVFDTEEGAMMSASFL